MDQNYDKIINTANNELQRRLDTEMGYSGFLRNGEFYGKVSAATGVPLIVRNYIPYKFRGISVPKIKDSKGKSWDMTDLETLTSESGPAASDLETMAEVAIMGMENEFKKIYDPSSKVTYEQPSNFSNYRMVMAAYGQASSGDPEDPPVSLNINDYFLVGAVVQGEFGKHHHQEFWDIMSQKETLDFLDQLLSKEQQRKAKKKADREGKIEAVVTVIAIAAASIVTGGAAAVALGPALAGAGTALYAISAIAVAGYIGYKGHQGYQAGGAAGGVLAIGSAVASMFGPAGMSLGGSYTKEQGFGFNVGAQFEGTPLNAGIGFSQKGGFGFNAGVAMGKNASLNLNLHESGAWGVGLSLHNANKGDRRGIAANIGYRETSDGQVGRSAGFGYNMGVGEIGTLYMGLTTDTLLGNGFRVNLEEEHKNSSNAGALLGYEGEIGWSTGGGFQSSLELRFNSERFRNKLMGNGFSSNQEVALKEFDLVHGKLPPLERAKLKKEKGLPLSEEEVQAEVDEVNAKQREMNTRLGRDILNAIATVKTGLWDDDANNFQIPGLKLVQHRNENSSWLNDILPWGDEPSFGWWVRNLKGDSIIAPDGPIKYQADKIAKGDTIWSKAKEQLLIELGKAPTDQEISSRVNEIISLNPDINVNKLQVGQIIKLPISKVHGNSGLPAIDYQSVVDLTGGNEEKFIKAILSRKAFIDKIASSHGISPDAIVSVMVYEFFGNKNNRLADPAAKYIDEGFRGRGLGWGAIHDESAEFQFQNSNESELNNMRRDLDKSIKAIAEVLSVGATRYLEASNGKIDIRKDPLLMSYAYNIGVYSAGFNNSIKKVTNHYADPTTRERTYYFDLSGNHPAARWLKNKLPRSKNQKKYQILWGNEA
ncbi:LysM peptidoglycan-binding domain-containing protein [Leptospira yanagawae]|uniref:LysM peptidoglycan-binding domain-containing protein n=2 Tax=Leptospira yanagawae TaxID=293069 RepID=A0ABY2M1Y7_9LEPT|nr:LysM peptidoglycan-binding domain-containing protein [Leptospira yanagawae]